MFDVEGKEKWDVRGYRFSFNVFFVWFRLCGSESTTTLMKDSEPTGARPRGAKPTTQMTPQTSH